MDTPPVKWSLLRGLSYLFGNHDVAEQLSRLRADCFELRERLLEKNRVRPLSQQEDKIEIKESKPQDDVETWKQRREAEIVEEQALEAAKEPALFEKLEYLVDIDPELYTPVLLKAAEIRKDIANGTYVEPQERSA